MKKLLAAIAILIATFLTLPSVASAHVLVQPSQASVGQALIFTVSVPNERDSAVTSLKLSIPRGVGDVMPTAIAGWIIKTAGSGDDISAITWTGKIPVGQRQDFSFRAQVPANAGELDWKAYQTYADGTVVHWDQKPAKNEADDDVATVGPYSITTVTNDLTSANAANSPSSNCATLALVLSSAALGLSVLTFLRKRKK